MINKTMKKFGYPNTLVKDYDHWCVLLRPEQVTLGSLVLICKESVKRYSDISNEAFLKYSLIIKETENTLFQLFKYDKINYLMLMMVDPNVHFHVIPRYSKLKVFKGAVFNDLGWPGLPELSKHNQVSSKLFMNLKEEIKKAFIE
jgi:diadenosine tetraphosphate (Ap4A) HIT family hydrolase